MEEITSTAKIGIALMIVASVIITSFCVFTVISTFSRDFLEEQTRIVDYTDYELNDFVGTYLPVLALDTAISQSSYRNTNNILCTYTQLVFANGNASISSPTVVERVKWSDFVKSFVGDTACITKIEGMPGADTIILHVKVGD